MKRRFWFTLLLALLMVLLAACGGGGDGNGGDTETDEGAGQEEGTEPEEGGETEEGGEGEEQGEATGAGDPARGEELFTSTTIADTSAPGCVTCHSVEPTDDPNQPSPVGPSQYGIADRAAERVEGMSAEAYLRESIVDPNAYIVEGFAEGIMYQNYGEDLTEEQINDLVAYLMTLQAE